MKKKIKICFPLLIGLIFLNLIPLAQPDNQDNFVINQTGKKISVDGKKDNWGYNKELPINLSPSGEINLPSDDIEVNACFTYDLKHFYVLVAVEDDILEFPSRPVLLKSLPTLEIRFQWIEDFINSAHSYAETKNLKQWKEEIDFLTKKILDGKPALFPSGTIARLAHRSKINGKGKFCV